MIVEIFDMKDASGVMKTWTIVGNTSTRHSCSEAAYEHLRGSVREMQSAIDTAIAMHERNSINPNMPAETRPASGRSAPADGSAVGRA
jgi:hypothetical protein